MFFSIMSVGFHVFDGKIITLGGYESEEYFQKVAAYMNNKISELSQMPGYSRQAMETKHTLLSLNITDDYFKAKKQAEIFEQDLQQKDQEMYDLKHELISLKMQIEEARAVLLSYFSKYSLISHLLINPMTIKQKRITEAIPPPYLSSSSSSFSSSFTLPSRRFFCS